MAIDYVDSGSRTATDSDGVLGKMWREMVHQFQETAGTVIAEGTNFGRLWMKELAVSWITGVTTVAELAIVAGDAVAKASERVRQQAKTPPDGAASGSAKPAPAAAGTIPAAPPPFQPPPAAHVHSTPVTPEGGRVSQAAAAARAKMSR